MSANGPWPRCPDRAPASLRDVNRSERFCAHRDQSPPASSPTRAPLNERIHNGIVIKDEHHGPAGVIRPFDCGGKDFTWLA